MVDIFYLSFIISLTLILIFIYFTYKYMKLNIQKRYKIKTQKLFSFGLKIPNAIERSFWKLFKISNFRYYHYKYHNEDEVCQYCLLLGYSLPYVKLCIKEQLIFLILSLVKN